MKKVQGLARLGLVSAIAAALTACGASAPTAVDIQKALEQEIQQQIDLAAGNSSADVKEMMATLMPKIEKITVQSCESVADDAFQCTVEATASIKGRMISNTDSVRMSKTPTGAWAISR